MTTSAILLALTALAALAYTVVSLHIVTHGRTVADLTESLTRAEIAASCLDEHRAAISEQETQPINRAEIVLAPSDEA